MARMEDLTTFYARRLQREHPKTILIEFIVIRAPSPYNMLLGRTGLWKLQAFPSTVHNLLKFPTEEVVAIIQSQTSSTRGHSHVVQLDLVKPINEERSALVNNEEVMVNEKYKD